MKIINRGGPRCKKKDKNGKNSDPTETPHIWSSNQSLYWKCDTLNITGKGTRLNKKIKHHYRRKNRKSYKDYEKNALAEFEMPKVLSKLDFEMENGGSQEVMSEGTD